MLRMEMDTIGKVGRDHPQPSPVMNWMLNGFELLLMGGIAAAFARGQAGRDGALGADILEGPDAGRVRVVAIERMAGDVAPEHFIVGALHDALVRIEALLVEDGHQAQAGALEFVGGGVDLLEGSLAQRIDLIAEHVGHGQVGLLDHAIVRDAHADGRVHENLFEIDGKWLGHGVAANVRLVPRTWRDRRTGDTMLHCARYFYRIVWPISAAL